MFCKLTQKGFSPYSFLDSFAKTEEPLPASGDFWKNSLTGKVDITLQDYQHAIDIYKKFGCTNLGDYHDVYLKTDVLLLTDIFQKFRSVCLSVYQLDPAHFYSAANLSWESMPISTRVKVGLLEDIEMFLFYERGIRGGINGVGELRHFTANNPHLNAFGAFHDVKFLYAGTMQKMMPRRNYRWNSEITVKKILEIPESSNIGYFVEVDVKYPQYLHDLHNGLPLAPEKRTIRSSWLSPIAQSSGIKSNKTPKLNETLSVKKSMFVIMKISSFISNTG